MSSQPSDPSASAGNMQELSGTSSAHPPLPKMQSWGASGLQGLFKQPSAGGTNFADLLADPGEGEAGASPLFKWTSDGSMMEEVMKIYKESSPSTPTFAQQGSLSRESSFKEHPLLKDGSFTASLQAAFHSHLEDVEEQAEAEQAEVTDQGTLPPTLAATPALAQGSPTDSAPFTFTAVPADLTESPQLHVPSPSLAPPLGQSVQLGEHHQRQDQAPQTHLSLAKPPALTGQQQGQLPAQQAAHHQAQHAQQALDSHLFPGIDYLAGAQEQQLNAPVNPTAYQSQTFSQSMAQQSQLASLHPLQMPQAGPYLEAQLQPVGQQGAERECGAPGPSRALVTSGAMGAHAWSRPNSRPSTANSQPSQGSSSGSPPGSHQVQSADGSMQAHPRIVVRTSAPSPSGSAAPLQASFPAQQQPFVLQSKVVKSAGPPQSSTTSLADRSQNSVQQGECMMVTSQHQQPAMQYEHPRNLPMQQLQARPVQYYTQLTQQAPHYQQQQQQQQQQFQAGSFQELLSAPVFPDRYNSAPVPTEFQTHAHQAHAHHPLTAAQPTYLTSSAAEAVYSSQVLQQSAPVAPAPQGLPSAGNAQGSILQSSQRHPYQQQQQQHMPTQFTPSTYSVTQIRPQPTAHNSQMQTLEPFHPSSALPSSLSHVSSSGIASNAPQALSQHAYQHTYQLPSGQSIYNPQQGQVHQLQQQPQPEQQQRQQVQHQALRGGLHQQQALLSGFAKQAPEFGQPLDKSSGSMGSVQSAHSAQQPGVHAQSFTQPSWQSSLQHPGAALQQAGAAAQHSGAAAQHHVAMQTSGPLPSPALQQSNAGSVAHQGRAQMLDVLGLGQAATGQEPGQHGQLPQPFVFAGRPSNQVQQQPGLTAIQAHNSAGSLSGTSSDLIQSQGYSSGSWQADSGPHGSILLTSRPAAPSEIRATGKLVSFAPDPSQHQHQHAAVAHMPLIPSQEDSLSSESGAKENNRAQGMQTSRSPPVPSGRKFKRDRSSKNNSFSLPPVPPKKQASAVADFSPASSLEFGLHAAASAPIPQDIAYQEAATSAMRHNVSCQDLSAEDSGVSGRRADEAAAAGSSGAHSSDKSADAVLTADCTIDFTSAAWKAMSRKEKNRASAAASRARREAYTESLEDKVRRLQQEHDWLQNQIEPGSVPDKAEDPAPPLQRPPIRHLSF